MAQSQSADAHRSGPHLILYDGECGFCHGLVRFVLNRDAAGRFHFASLQGPAAAMHLARFGGVPSRLTTVYVVDNYLGGKATCRVKARAVFFVAKALGWPWRLAALLAALPTAWLDLGYDLAARNRYRLPGRPDTCLVPRPEHRARFLDSPSGSGSGSRSEAETAQTTVTTTSNPGSGAD